jgi:Protein kinase domain
VVRDQQAGAGYLAELGPGLGPGARIAGYWLEEQIGRGGMAVVFRARDERLHRLVALKVLAPALAGDDEFRLRFIRESRAAAAVDDPHIIPVFDAGEAAGALFIAMRFVPGGDVYSLVRGTGPLSAARAVAIVSPVASALDAAHAAGLVHRDVKPANMLLDTRPGRPDHVYLSDFGLSKGAVSMSTGLTGAGHFMGTLDYISPEQIEGERADGRADQYALACSAYEMLTGAPPFRAGEPAALMYAQLRQPPPALTSRRPDLPPAADQVLARALAKNPADRYASCREFADALRAAFGLASYDSGPEPVPPAEHPPAAERPAAAEHPPQEEDAPALEHAPAGPARPTSADGVPRPAPPTRPAAPGRHAAAAAPPAPSAPPAPPARSARPAAFGRPAPASRRPSRRVILAALVAVLVLAAAAIGAYLLHSRPSGGPLAAILVAAAWPGHHQCGASSVDPASYLG